MRLYYPKSFLKLVLIGLSLVALPLLCVLISAAVSLDLLAERSEKAVYDATRATQASRRVHELIGALERNARQYVILGDAGILDSYRANRERLLRAAAEFERLSLEAQQRKELDALLAGERTVYGILSDSTQKADSVKRAVEEFVTLSDLAQSIMARSSASIDREVDALRETAGNARVIVFWQLLALVPVLGIVLAGFTVMIARPIGQIDRAIRRLGDGQLATEISVGGPEDLQYLGRQLDWMRRRLVELEEEKNRFLRHVSHELKTPLTALREGAELLAARATGPLAPEQAEIVEILRGNSVRLQALIEDLLSYGVVQFHKLTLAPAEVNLGEVIAQVLANHKAALKSKGVNIDVRGTDLVLTADPDKLRIVVDNLISNAIKFSPAGGSIRVVAEHRDSAAVLEVIDTGPGIGMGEAARVFEPFFRGAAAQDSRIKGTGLGLSIVKEYVAAHAGTVEVIATGRPGAHLRVTLPCALASARVQSA